MPGKGPPRGRALSARRTVRREVRVIHLTVGDGPGFSLGLSRTSAGGRSCACRAVERFGRVCPGSRFCFVLKTSSLFTFRR